MELIEHTTEWVRGEVLQGRTMIIIGILIAIAGVFILKSDHTILRGTLIPLGLSAAILIGYGSFQVIARPGHVQNVETKLSSDPQMAIKTEYEKAQKDHRIYSMVTNYIYPILMMIVIALYFFYPSDQFRGIMIGCFGLFLTLIVLDSTLNYRLKTYMSALELYMN